MDGRHEHPLAIDLLAYAAGDLDGSAVSMLEDHLRGCLLCRIRLGRIRRHDTSAGSPPLDAARPPVPAALLDALNPDRKSPVPGAGQVWLAGREQRVLVWIRTSTDRALTAHPMTIDIDQVDDTALIVDACPTIDEPVAIVTSIVATVAPDALVAHLGDLPVAEHVDAIVESSLTGIASNLPTGLPITSPADERLEFRQLLADAVAALDPVDDGEDDQANTDLGGVIATLVDLLRDELLPRRGSRCHIDSGPVLHDQIPWPSPCWPVARIRELDCAVVVVTGTASLAWTLDNGDHAARLLARSNATALAVSEPHEPFEAAMFEHHDLVHAYEPPRATAPKGPRIGHDPRPLVKALDDYLDRAAFPSRAAAADRALEPPSTDLAPLLRAHASTAVAEFQSQRAQKTKREALRSLTPADGAALAELLHDAGDLHVIISGIDRMTER